LHNFGKGATGAGTNQIKGLPLITGCYSEEWQRTCSNRSGLRARPARRAVTALVMRQIVANRVIAFLCLGVCSALGQQPAETHSLNSLPDAPSANAYRIQLYEALSPEPQTAVGINAFLMRQSESDSGSLVGRTAFDDPGRQGPVEKNFNVLGKYLHSTLLARNLGYHPSMNGTIVGRAGYAASSIFLTQDQSGRRRLNTSYLVGVLSSALVQTAYRPYWRRSVSEPFSNFGSNIGSDAGMNFLHEFGPGIEQLMKSHAPRFVYRIGERIGR
jgi:hypothetical protein